jgi:hypothetical protein
MRDFLTQKAATFHKDTALETTLSSAETDTSDSLTPPASLIGVFEVTIDPEHFRLIQEQLNLLTSGNGLLEILHQSSVSNSNVNVHHAALRASHRDEEGDSLAQTGQDAGSEGGADGTAEESLKVSGGPKEKASKKKGKSSRLPPGPGPVEDEEEPALTRLSDDEGEVLGLARNKGKVSCPTSPPPPPPLCLSLSYSYLPSLLSVSE